MSLATVLFELELNPAQMLGIRLGPKHLARDDRSAIERNIFSEKHLIRRPVLQALEGAGGRAPVFLIDELDWTDEAFEGFSCCLEFCRTTG